MHTDDTLPSDSIMTVDMYDRKLDTYFVREGIKKEQKGRFGEHNAQGVYTPLVP